MLFAGLILFQCRAITVIAQQSMVKPLASLDERCDRWAADYETMVFDTSEALESLELSGEVGFVGCGDICAELEED